MQTRREFMSLAARLAAGTGAIGSFLESIGRAHAIEAKAGSSFLDAEHVVILMQENRSFDHAFGTLRGVRGFNDPRAISLADGNPVWVQSDAAGKQYVPFRFDINATKITWMGSLPHSWADQVDARNNGQHDKWLIAKRSGHREYADMPLTLGYYTRANIPVYYALADAFTICDQYFCSSLTGTTPNRCYLWTGTIRERPTAAVPANVRNDEVDYGQLAKWTTFPERLEDLGVSWKVYQNELSVGSGLSGDEDAWLANFTDNPLEFFSQYHVHLVANHRSYVEERVKALPGEIATLKKQLEIAGPKASDDDRKRLAKLSRDLKDYLAEKKAWAGKSLSHLSPRERALHEKALSTNAADPNYRRLTEISYRDGDSERRMLIPKGDVLHEFRNDVNSGKLPTVSWLVAPEAFSDHPSSAWYGAWYIAEVLDILTRNPDVWRKTVFILTYDENDGYFDHVPPFVAPHPARPETGRVSKGIDASVEYVELEQDRQRTDRLRARGGPIGLGYRVPFVIASPWSRGGCVCSQVFDHTSVLQFLEVLLSHKLGKKVEEPNISKWRRTVCGDLTSSFQSAANESGSALKFPPRDEFLESIHKAQFKDVPTGFHALSPDELAQVRRNSQSPLLPQQEPGVRPSSPLPYQLEVEGGLNDARTHFKIGLAARTEQFGKRSAGSPFIVHTLGSKADVKIRNYAVEAGQGLEDSWALSDFENKRYHLRVYGPNGFYREFVGGSDDPPVNMWLIDSPSMSAESANTERVFVYVEITGKNRSLTFEVRDNAYGNPVSSRTIPAGKHDLLTVDTKQSAGWYDFSVRVTGNWQFERRYAGRMETGNWSTSDPEMGRATNIAK